ncbi:MAG: winged helix-turn-helix transcriptional regulator [Thermoplasmata archaeon]|nr:winged helix-turn-helix transcriptional regulator [Thermoplasmata archaeon]
MRIDTDEVAAQVRELLALDRSLNPSDRKVLECLLLEPGPMTARELARRTRCSVPALYLALDRLESRGVILRDRRASHTTFRAAHPSAVLHELLDPWRRAGDIAGRIEAPLRQLHEIRGESAPTDDPKGATVTTSLTSCLSALLGHVHSVRSEIWVIGSEAPWLTHSPLVERELISKSASPPGVRVRLLVRKPPASSDEARRLRQLQEHGVEVRYSGKFATPAVVVDRRWLFLQNALPPERNSGTASYVQLDAPTLCADLAASSEETWARSVRTP